MEISEVQHVKGALIFNMIEAPKASFHYYVTIDAVEISSRGKANFYKLDLIFDWPQGEQQVVANIHQSEEDEFMFDLKSVWIKRNSEKIFLYKQVKFNHDNS